LWRLTGCSEEIVEKPLEKPSTARRYPPAGRHSRDEIRISGSLASGLLGGERRVGQCRTRRVNGGLSRR
jgi:hypothetical protein